MSFENIVVFFYSFSLWYKTSSTHTVIILKINILFISFLGCTRLRRLKIHFHKETYTGLQRLSCFATRTRHRTFMNLKGKISPSRNFCMNCNHYKRLSKRKLIKTSNQSWLSSMSTERTWTSSIVTRCQNS